MWLTSSVHENQHLKSMSQYLISNFVKLNENFYPNLKAKLFLPLLFIPLIFINLTLIHGCHFHSRFKHSLNCQLNIYEQIQKYINIPNRFLNYGFNGFKLNYLGFVPFGYNYRQPNLFLFFWLIWYFIVIDLVIGASIIIIYIYIQWSNDHDWPKSPNNSDFLQRSLNLKTQHLQNQNASIFSL